MDYLLVFSDSVAAIICLYLFIIHIIQRRHFSISRVFLLISLAVFIQYLLLIMFQVRPDLISYPLIIKTLFFIPLFTFSLALFIASVYPDGKIRESLFTATAALVIIIADLVIIFLSPVGEGLKIDPVTGVVKNNFSVIQLGLILLLMIMNPVILLIRINRFHMNRIRYSVTYYLFGILFSYALFIAIYYAGAIYGHYTLIKNPLLPLPVVFIIVITGYLLLDIRNNDFSRFYKRIFFGLLSFTVYSIPVYLFLKNTPRMGNMALIEIIIKSSVVFIYVVAAYRLLNLLRNFILKRNLNRLIKGVNEIVVPVHELKKITDMEKFWNFITRENFQGLRRALGIKSAYFMLANRKENGYSYAYGYGPGLEPDFLPSGSNIIRDLSSYRGIFEKSYLLTDINLNDSRKEISDFFTNNRLEASVSFRNMSDSIMGFLFLGSIDKGKAYTADILEAIEILRIKLQSLLITGLILDEVTADQVDDHDRTVVNTVKKRILPDGIVSIPGLRISSLSINNSSLGGDYVDAVRIGKDSSIIMIADTSYNGIESALASLELYSILHTRTMTFNSAEKVLITMNQVLKTSRITSIPVKASCVIVSSDGNFTYSNASLNPMIIYDTERGSISEVETTSIPLGIEMDYRYSMTSARLRENSIGVLYSDGILSGRNKSGEAYSLSRLRETVIKFSKQNPSIITREIYRDFKAFTSGVQPEKDISVIVFKKVKTSDE